MAGEKAPDAERAGAEALDWIVRLQEEPEDAVLRRQFEAWRAASAANATAWEETSRVYAGIGDLPPVHAGRWGRLAAERGRQPGALAIGRGDRLRGRGTREFGRRWAPVALAGLAAAIVVAVLVPRAMLRWQADAITGTAELRTVTLADGSVAALAPDTAIRIAYGQGERRVTLLRGQAWFEVRHDASRPFRVIAGAVETTDLGTAFDVQLAAESTNIAVASGAVRVDDGAVDPAVSERLTGGQSLSISAAGEAVRGQEPSDLVGSWRDGQLAVEGQPMQAVIAALRPWYSGLIVVAPGVRVGRPVTGVYDLRDPAAALTALAKAYGGHVTRITPWLLVLSQG